MPLETRSLEGSFACEVAGLRLWERLEHEIVDELRELWAYHPVLVFRRQALSEQELAGFSALFGPLERVVRTEWASPAVPEVGLISNLKDGQGRPIGGLGDGEIQWHSDQSYMMNPATGAVLYALELPPDGGTTSWVDLSAAYAGLPDRLKRLVEGRSAVFDYVKRLAGYQGVDRVISEEARRKTPPVFHPLVHTHPVTGRKALYLDSTTTVAVDGMDEATGTALLDDIYEFATRREFVYRHDWQVGDLVMWDNGSTMHRREPFDPAARRLMKRTTIFLARRAPHRARWQPRNRGDGIVNAATEKDLETGLIEKARRVLPGGTFGNFPGDVVIREGRGGRVWDESGREYVDFLLGSGPMLVGHAHPEVTAAAQAVVAKGTTFFANNRYGIELAEAIVDAVPCAEQVRFVSTGSEADLYAMRAARAFKRRDKILKFEGGYHGMSDYSLMSLAPKRSGNFPQPVPDSAGIPRSLRDEMLVAPFNDLEVVAESRSRAQGGVWPASSSSLSSALFRPRRGFSKGCARSPRRMGCCLIFDEVVTGFRLAYGGAQEYYGVVPDLCTLGKVIGGGFPLAAIAGRADIMAHFDRGAVGDEGFLMQIGTLSGNPVAAAAGLATLEILRRPGAYDRLFATGRELMEALAELLKRKGIAAQVTGEPPLFDAVFGAEPVRDYRSTLRGDADMLRRFNALLRDRGILKGESKYYVSLAHTAEDVRHTRDAWAAASAAIAR